jgi:beta-lactamase superfamily II metal-dependent hydrolase
MGSIGASDQSFIVEMLPAEHGDCLLVSARQGSASTNLLVDCGPIGTYKRVLRPRLQALAAAGQVIDLLVVTHVDNDHIQGAVEFLEDNGEASNPRIIQVKEVWHNSYRHLPTSKGIVPTADQLASVVSHCQWSRPNEQGLIGAKEGSSLALLLQRHGYNWNESFGGGAIRAGNSTFVGDVKVDVLAPSEGDLEKLLYWWKKELLQIGVSQNAIASLELETPFELRLYQQPALEPEPTKNISANSALNPPKDSDFKSDASKVNGSSIVVLAEFKGLKLLLLGDAPTSELESRWPVSLPMDLNAVKVSHHGSRANTSPAFLKQIRAKRFLVSANGKNGHPHPESLLRIVSSQGDCQLFFNYETDQSQLMASKEATEKFKHSTVIGHGKDGHSTVIDLASL